MSRSRLFLVCDIRMQMVVRGMHLSLSLSLAHTHAHTHTHRSHTNSELPNAMAYLAKDEADTGGSELGC